ncbi:hypothetical protein HU200_022900 [Digitaria exilis]|uniref:Glycosyltransferase n=1 Tax=Digitaria exilis TaxID=1010633 RepID=A0A835EXW0_9POAL|nr:hypothetical protein HU200_022900 [Digitaria exilis]
MGCSSTVGSSGHLSSFVRTTDPDHFGLRFNESEANKSTNAGALVLNTLDNLEADVLAALRAEYPRMYTIGPLGSLLRGHNLNPETDSTGLSLWKQDVTCLSRLHTQEQRSVVYVNFGSLTVVTPEQLAEDNLVLGTVRGRAALPPAFMAETAGWCPQEQVLGHPAVGGFLTHSGWNTTCESLAAGVPMVCWPGFADQYTNCKYACDVWGVGAQMDAEVRREQVMGSEEILASAGKWKAEALAVAATSTGGSSYENLLSMIPRRSRSVDRGLLVQQDHGTGVDALGTIAVTPGKGPVDPSSIGKLAWDVMTIDQRGPKVDARQTQRNHVAETHFPVGNRTTATLCPSLTQPPPLPHPLSNSWIDYGASGDGSSRVSTVQGHRLARLGGFRCTHDDGHHAGKLATGDVDGLFASF